MSWTMRRSMRQEHGAAHASVSRKPPRHPRLSPRLRRGNQIRPRESRETHRGDTNVPRPLDCWRSLPGFGYLRQHRRSRRSIRYQRGNPSSPKRTAAWSPEWAPGLIPAAKWSANRRIRSVLPASQRRRLSSFNLSSRDRITAVVRLSPVSSASSAAKERARGFLMVRLILTILPSLGEIAGDAVLVTTPASVRHIPSPASHPKPAPMFQACVA